MSQNPIPARVSSPGTILDRELKARHWSQQEFADKMQCSASEISDLIRGDRDITPDIAKNLAKVLETRPEFWLNLATNYRLFLARKEQQAKVRYLL